MNGSPAVLEALNEILTAELTAINQYFIHAKMCDNWGYERLAEKMRDESIDEMKDADAIIERILYLDGVPNMQRLGPVKVGETVHEQLELALRARDRGHRPVQPGDRARASPRATTAPATCSKRSSAARRSTPTGSRASSTSSARSASRTTSPSRSATDWALLVGTGYGVNPQDRCGELADAGRARRCGRAAHARRGPCRGHLAVGSPAEAGLKPQLVHYYFRRDGRPVPGRVPSAGRGGPRTSGSGAGLAGAAPGLVGATAPNAPGRHSTTGVHRRWPTTARPSGRRSPATPSSSVSQQAELLAKVMGDHGVDPDELPP